MPDNYRKIFKWGDPGREETLDEGMVALLRQTFSLSDEELLEIRLPGLEDVRLKKKSKLCDADLKAITDIVGSGNASTADFDRAANSYAKSYHDLIRLRLGKIDNSPDAVVYPADESEIVKLLKFCGERRIPVTASGGRSSVTGALETPAGGIVVDLSRRMNRVVCINEINQSVTVQPGIMGPELEKNLNVYKGGYTCGHFPQSFEYSTVGGWVAARGAGQSSTGYGKIEDIVLSMRMVTPEGIVATTDYPAKALGPDINEILTGSEGIFGILTEVTLKIRRFLPENTVFASFIFRGFPPAVNAMREIMQGQFGKPFLFRLSDPEESDVSFRVSGSEGSIGERALQAIGFKPGKRCLMYFSVEGDFHYTRFVARKIRSAARRNGGMYIGSHPVNKWLEQRYSSCYLRDPLMDHGIMTDTLETAVTWENLVPLWSAVRAYIKRRPKTVCMTHISHCYENGANLYFIFLSPMIAGNEIDDYAGFQKGIIDTIKANKGSLSHHHGIGRIFAPWMEMEVGKTGLGIIRAVKDFLDPKGIMNPGSTLGLK
ncbi:MAG: FAD-binding oxidoreductase [Spirochaetes bacterium]|jgi:alkyldihydroxyacetonephosphate synthase|nr:FAD-binding oxidoreductase [Spirochaetota bacterium]